MSTFVCPHCQGESKVFPPVSGGAEKMCKDMNVPLLGRVPLEPNLLLSCEKGACYMK